LTNRRIGGLPTGSIATFANTAQLRNKVARQCRRDDEPAGETKKPTRTQRPSGATHDYVRHGSTTLFAALEIATGKVTGTCQPRHRHQEFLRFLKQVA
jgi:hypothetical protein